MRWLTYLHHTASVKQHDLVSLAVRLETLLITANGATVRPPRAVALGLAVYLWSLADRLPRQSPQTLPEQRGAALFAARCERCHAPPGYTGAPVLLSTIGTAPKLGQSVDRGTGTYRVPSLRGVSTRGALFHDGALPSLAALLDPARLRPDYRGRHELGPVAGHLYGLDLDPAARADLLAFLSTL